jgi:hypothetical protein
VWSNGDIDTLGDLIIGDAAYIGSASDPDAMQFEADGDVVLSQKLGIGAVSPTYQLDVASAGSNVVGRLDSTASSACRLYFVNTGSTAAGYTHVWSQNDDLVFTSANAEALRLGASQLATFAGNVVIPDAGYIGSASDTDAIQIEADGDVLFKTQVGIGVTPSYSLDIKEDTAGFVMYIENDDSDAEGILIDFGADPDVRNEKFLHCTGNGASRTIIYSNGDVWTSDDGFLTCDPRLKRGIATATPKLADLMRLDVISFEWNRDIYPDARGGRRIGYNAENVADVFPALAGAHEFAGVGGESVVALGVKRGVIGSPIVVKALQEHVAETRQTREELLEEIDDLKRRLRKLERS